MVLYFIIMRIVGRRYFGRRHGVPAEPHEQGMAAAGAIGLAWPVTIWLPQVRDPEPCVHIKHIRQREHTRDEIIAAGVIRQREVEERNWRRQGR
ncbi:hypothetical protein [Saccharothrix hoggarensis]|uniref:Uncharacterized protein n=1 Tax=Saccharothrix hoggarensis TaxID=913853 RepID=A0ABW3R267_9PSEU